MTDYTVKIEKWLIWGVLVGVLYLLRDLFPVIFLTFILTYIGNTAVFFLTSRFPRRRFNLTLIYLVFITVLLALGSLIVPRIFGEARDLAKHYIGQDQDAGSRPETALETPRRPERKAEIVGTSHPRGDTGVTSWAGASGVGDTRTVIVRETTKYLDKALIQLLGARAFESFKISDIYDNIVIKFEAVITDFIPRIIEGVKTFVNNLFKIAFHFVLAIIFSFLILWDFPRLKSSVASFSKGRSAAVYAEIAPGLHAFGVMLGKAFEAQSGIAVINAILTSLGFFMLGIPSIALLSTIVFFCSYIPVLGVILSSLPAALLALKVGSFVTIAWLVVMILVVHAIETYMLNPIIYGHHLSMHPVGVLVILLVGEHLFGVWGMILGVPISAFVLRYVIEGQGAGPMGRDIPASRADVR